MFQSVNGVHVNGVKCVPEEEKELQDGAEVVLAPGSPFQWKFQIFTKKDKSSQNSSQSDNDKVENGEESCSRKRTSENDCNESDVPDKKRTKIGNSESGDKVQENEEEKESVIQKFKNKFNEELSCTICNEVFISPMSLPCGHVFCKFCLMKWKQSCHSRPFDCPNCRQKVGREKLTPNFCLENLIASWTKELGPDMLAARNKSIKEREGN